MINLFSKDWWNGPLIEGKKEYPNLKEYNTLVHKCRECNKEIAVGGFFVKDKDRYCQCDKPKYFTVVKKVKRAL